MLKRAYEYNMYVWAMLAFIFIFAACDRIEDEPDLSDEVSLQASLSPALSIVYTKGIGEIRSDYSEPLEIGMARVVGETGDFNGADNSALVATMEAPSGVGLRDIEFDAFQGFPDAYSMVNYIGWYPGEGSAYNNPETGRTTVDFDVDGSTDILYSDVAHGARLQPFNIMTFRHALVKYSVKVYAMEEEGGNVNDFWGQLKAVHFGNMYGQCTLNLPTSYEALPEISSSGNKTFSKDVTLDKFPVGFSNAADVAYVLAPPPMSDRLTISVTTQKEGEDAKTSEALAIVRDFKPGKHYQIYLRFSPHGLINAEAVAGEWNDGGEIDVPSNLSVYYNLSETHTANSYIISSPNRYCIDVTVRGNGYTGLAGIPGSDINLYKVGDPVSAEIVWTDLVSATNQNMDEIFTLSPKVVEGRVFFNVKPIDGDLPEGNVVIGVKDAGGNMLWTWHLWLTDRPAEQGYKNGFAVQDRDMGAVSYDAVNEPEGINGLYYQWGRPSPLPLGKTVYRPEYDGNGVWESNTAVQFTSSDEEVKVIDRVASPTVYYNQRATATDALLTKSLWGWRTETDEYAKTIYDPCPPGYRVPSKRLWRDLVIHDPKVVKESGNNIAVTFKVDVNNENIYYPMTGYYEELTKPKDNHNGAYMWAATFEIGNVNDASDDHPYALDFALDSYQQLQAMETRVEYSNYAMPVRCISRMSKAHVTNLSDYQTANSYIVPKDGYYKFKATVRGNGVGQLVSPGSTSTIVLTEQLNTVDIKNQLVKVEPLWWYTHSTEGTPTDYLNTQSEQNRLFTMLNGGAPDADGYVSFKVDKWYEGNMILAGKDAKGDIIWSWHIWFTDEPQMMKSNSFVVMDRNLGATHAPVSPTEPTGGELSETYGMYYQWGRKDPFAAPGDNVYQYNGSAFVQTNSAFSTTAVAAEKSVGNSVMYPMTYHLASAPDDSGVLKSNQSNLMNSFNVSAIDNSDENQCFSNMVRPDERRSLWGYSASSGYGVTTTKTMYDPCPPGYIVAHYLVWTNTDRNASSSYLYYSKLDGGFKSHGITGNNYNGIFLTEYSSLFDPAWYPYSGYINGRSFDREQCGDKTSGMGVFHTSTPAGNGARSLMYDSIWSGQGVDGDYWGLPSSFGYPVRCQKE